MALYAAPRAPKGDQGWIFWYYKSNYLFSLSGRVRTEFVIVFIWLFIWDEASETEN